MYDKTEQRFSNMSGWCMWIMNVLYLQDLLNWNPITLGLLIINSCWEKNYVNPEIPIILATIGLSDLPFLPQSQLPKKHSTKKRQTMLHTIGNYFLPSRISLTLTSYLPLDWSLCNKLYWKSCRHYCAILISSFYLVWTLEHCWMYSPRSMRIKSLCIFNVVILWQVLWTPFQTPFSSLHHLQFYLHSKKWVVNISELSYFKLDSVFSSLCQS